ncbi:MAG TPA: hypothetical protein VGN28_13185 [Blastococcus sp.]|jgi:hypothetical protein|nr:hypothetical protein [Blastococcus sp.]
MARRDPRGARILGLWTAGWLAVLLVAGLLWVGDLSIQWPVLAVPLLWALVAARPRRRRVGTPVRDRPRGWEVVPPGRTDTVERPAVYDPRDGRSGPA